MKICVLRGVNQIAQKLIYSYSGACLSVLTRTGILSDLFSDLDACTYHKVMKLNLDQSVNSVGGGQWEILKNVFMSCLL